MCNLTCLLEVEVEEFLWFNTKAGGQQQNGAKCRAAFAPLDAPDLAQRQTAAIGEFFLCKLFGQTKLFQVGTERGYIFLISVLAHK
jgi:hypothetical protein